MGVDRSYGWHPAGLRNVPRAAALGLGAAASVLLDRVQVGLVLTHPQTTGVREPHPDGEHRRGLKPFKHRPEPR